MMSGRQYQGKVKSHNTFHEGVVAVLILIAVGVTFELFRIIFG
jgi:hypothetical protein